MLRAEVTLLMTCMFLKLKKCGFIQQKLRISVVQRDSFLRLQFISAVSLYDQDRMIFIDETGIDWRNFITMYALQKLNCYFNTSSLLPQLQTCFGVLSSLVGWAKRGNSCLSMNVLDTHVIHDTHPTSVFGIHIQVAPSMLIHVMNNECGGWYAAWM